MRASKRTGDSACRRLGFFGVAVLLTSVSLVTMTARGQDASAHTTMTGTVTAVSTRSLVIKTEGGQYRLFIIDKNTVKPKDLSIDSTVRVTSTPTDDPEVRLAILVTAAQAGATSGTAAQPDVVPESVRKTEKALEREAKLLHAGFQGGFTLDPEMIDIGVHAKVGPFFNKNLYVRPNAVFAWGEITRMFGINVDVIYNFPFTASARRWVYVGVGPGFNFAEQSAAGQGVSFSEFHYDAALNILLGIQHRSGLFTELRTGVYAHPAPVLWMTVGYSF